MIRQKIQRREPLVEELRSFSDAVRYQREPHVRGEDALQALVMANRLVELGTHPQALPVLLERAVNMPMA